MKIFGSSGIRQIADAKFISLVERIGLAVALGSKKIIIGGDHRISTPEVKDALIKGLVENGANVSDAGLVPTPTLAFAARNFDLGIMVTASHNPQEYNGLKFWNPDGSAFDSGQEIALEQAISGDVICPSRDRAEDRAIPYPGAVEEHIQAILKLYGKLDGLKVVLDCGGGAGSVITPDLLRRMGAEVIPTFCSLSGIFPRPSEPVKENLAELIATVRKSAASLGLAHDGDADRLVAVDKSGAIIPGEKLMVALARRMMATTIVTTQDASGVVERAGFNVRRTRVGDSAVSAELKRLGEDFGGEPCGAMIFPKISFCPDGVHAAALVSSIAKDTDLTSLVADIPSCHITRVNLSFDFKAPELNEIEGVMQQLNPSAVDRTDGLRIVIPEGWILVRYSGTEQKLRLTLETTTEKQGQAVLTDVINKLKRLGFYRVT